MVCPPITPPLPLCYFPVKKIYFCAPGDHTAIIGPPSNRGKWTFLRLKCAEILLHRGEKSSHSIADIGGTTGGIASGRVLDSRRTTPLQQGYGTPMQLLYRISAGAGPLSEGHWKIFTLSSHPSSSANDRRPNGHDHITQLSTSFHFLTLGSNISIL